MVNPESHREPPKSPMPPVIVKKGKKDDAGDDAAGETAAPQQKLLPTGLSRSIVIAAIIASLMVGISTLFADRYELVPAPSSANGFMYRIDKLFGAVQFCGPQGCSDLPQPEK